MSEVKGGQPLFSVILTSHRKPVLVRQAIASVLAQRFTDYELMIIDSGELYGGLYEEFGERPGVAVVRSAETEEIRRLKHVVSWVYNQFVPTAAGRFITYLCDDDLYYPSYLEAFAAAIEDGVHCYWTGIAKERHKADGTFLDSIGVEMPNLKPQRLKSDYLQLCHSKACFMEFAGRPGGEVWNERPADHYGCDGQLMEIFHARWPFKRVDGVHAVNRRTPLSAFCGS